MKPLVADKEQEVVVEIAGVKMILTNRVLTFFPTFQIPISTGGLRNLLRLLKSNWLLLEAQKGQMLLPLPLSFS